MSKRSSERRLRYARGMKAGLRPIFEILNLDMQEAMGERVFGSLVESVGEGFGTGARVSRAAKRGKADTVKGAR